ncbi:Uncharacterised protein [Corynebacterium pseudotuberculosis]|nr:Uncharacterised protein [Corynebacterium pseudotuberculosis]
MGFSVGELNHSHLAYDERMTPWLEHSKYMKIGPVNSAFD